MKESKFAFLTSERFWGLVIGAVSIYLQAKGIIGEPEMVLIATITAGFIGIGTIDKFSKKNTTTTVTMPEGVSSVSASTDN